MVGSSELDPRCFYVLFVILYILHVLPFFLCLSSKLETCKLETLNILGFIKHNFFTEEIEKLLPDNII